MQSPEMPLWVMVLFCFFLGAFTASLYGIYEVIVQRQTIRQLKHNLEILASRAETAPAPRPRPRPPPRLQDHLAPRMIALGLSARPD